MNKLITKVTLVFIISMSFLYVSEAQVIDDFSLDNLDNELVSLEELKGKQLTAIDFWATWCKPCTKAMPKLNELYNEFKDEGLSVIGISCDGPRSIGQVPAVASNLAIDYPILTDIDCEVMNTYQYQAFPTFILLNSDNEVVYVHEGFRSGDEDAIKHEIEQHLK